MELNTRTVYSAYLQTCLLSQLPFQLKPYTTLNERFNILSDILPVAGQMPRLGYMGIGNGGHRMVVGAGGKVKPEPIQHLATDASAYDPLPFILRLPTEDLTPVERANYALRKEVVYNETTYIAYYLRRIDFSGVLAAMEYRTVQDDGSTVVTPFVPDNSNLFPTPQPLSNSGTNLVSGEYVSASAKVAINLSPWEAQELLNVSRIMYGDEDFAIISEIQLVTGIDKTINVTGPNGSFVFNEVIAAQVAQHVAAFYPVRFSTNGIEIYLDIGASEPLWKLVSP